VSALRGFDRFCIAVIGGIARWALRLAVIVFCLVAALALFDLLLLTCATR